MLDSMIDGIYRPLNLRHRNNGMGPLDGELVVLYLETKSELPAWQYVAGEFYTHRGKTYFRRFSGGEYIASDLQERFKIAWTRLPAYRDVF